MGLVGSVGFGKSIYTVCSVRPSILLFHLHRLNVEKSTRHLHVEMSAVDLLWVLLGA